VSTEEACAHRHFRYELASDAVGGWAECRDCGKIADFDIEFDDWWTPDEYERRQAEDDAFWHGLRNRDQSEKNTGES
jgi:hypothetical protein